MELIRLVAAGALDPVTALRRRREEEVARGGTGSPRTGAPGRPDTGPWPVARGGPGLAPGGKDAGARGWDPAARGREAGARVRDPAAERAAEKAAEQARRVNAVMAELDALVGLPAVKRMVREVRAFVQVQQLRTRADLAAHPTTLHMAFTGHPGTGKTTVARLLGRLFKELEVLSRGHLLEVERADLVGEYIGHTAQRTREMVKKALGGVLFVDEAYSLARGGDKDFGRESIDCLVRAMEEHRGELVVILAGYPAEMEWLVEQNPGLRSRIAVWMHFPDYTPAELMEIARTMLEGWQYRLGPEAAAHLQEQLSSGALDLQGERGNARALRNLLEKALRCHALRVVDQPDLERQALMTVSLSDVEAAVALVRGAPGAGPGA